MGWNNWNAFHCDVNESLLLTTAQDMIDFGLRDLGYNYIVLDDCWSVGRNESGYLVEDSMLPTNGSYSFGNEEIRIQVSEWHTISC